MNKIKDPIDLISGITGQDGPYLAKFLLDKGYKIYGLYRRTSTPNFWRLKALGVFDKIKLIQGDMTDMSSLIEALKISNPDEVYNLAAQSYVGASFEQPLSTAEITGIGVMKLLEAIRLVNPKIKMYQASTSELFGNAPAPQSETTPFEPASPYAVAKLYALWSCRVYRDAYNMFICNGILFNHESPLRGLEFVTRKITNAVARIKLGLQEELVLGNMTSYRDWGFAGDYVENMWLMLQQDKPDDYVVASGETHTVLDFVKEAFDSVDLHWKKYVKSDMKLMRPLDVNKLQGDITKSKKILKWKPKTSFKQLVSMMVEADLKRWQDHLDGKSFPWDANLGGDDNLIISARYKLDK